MESGTIIERARARVPTSVTLGEAVDNTGLTWSTFGSAHWFGQTSTSYYGGDAAQSGNVIDDAYTWIQTTIAGPGTLSFYWKVSSEASYDYLEFYIDGALQSEISGEVDWQQKSFSLASGSHTLVWSYSKDRSVSAGSDAGWLDRVQFTSTPTSTITVTAPNGGENWMRGTVHTVAWTSTGSPGANVKIELLKGGALNTVVSSSTANNGSYSWNISSTQTLGTDYEIRITSTSITSITDSSNNNFAIATDEVVVDDVSAVFVGSWTGSSAIAGYYGVGYRYHGAGTGSNTATWSFSIPTAGSWQVYAWWTTNPNRATNAKYTINYAGGSTTVTVNQQVSGGTWVSLGTYSFNAGLRSVVLSDNASGIVIADAVRLVYLHP